MKKLLSIIILKVFLLSCNLAIAGDDGKIKLNSDTANGYVEVNDCFERKQRYICFQPNFR